MARKVVSFTGLATNGNVAIPGLHVGDQVLAVMITAGSTPGTLYTQFFGAFVVTAAQLIQMGAGDVSAITFAALIDRQVIL
jgi:hypothetical protein